MDQSENILSRATSLEPVSWFEQMRQSNRKLAYLPAMKRMNALLAQFASSALTEFLKSHTTAAPITVDVKAPEQLKAVNQSDDFIALQTMTADTAAFLLLPHLFLERVTSILFGGNHFVETDAECENERAWLTPLDKSIALQLAVVLFQALKHAWPAAIPSSLQAPTMMTSEEWLAEVTPTAEWVLFQVTVSFCAGQEVVFSMGCPAHALSLFADQLNEKKVETAHNPELWSNQLIDNLQDCIVPLIAKMPPQEYFFKEVVGWQAGSILPIDDPALAVLFTEDNVPLYRASVGQRNGKLVFELDKCLFQ